MQLLKTLFLSSVTDDGIHISVRDSHELKTISPINSTDDGIKTFLSDLHL